MIKKCIVFRQNRQKYKLFKLFFEKYQNSEEKNCIYKYPTHLWEQRITERKRLEMETLIIGIVASLIAMVI